MVDIPNNTSTTSVLTGSGSYSSALEVNDDSDWWAVDLEAGKTYDFKISGDGSASSLGDGRIVIRDALGNEIDSTGSQNTPLSITAATTGRYYIEVKDNYTYDNAAEGNYVLTANMSDDIVNNVTTTRVITTTGVTASSLAQSNDSDWFKVSLKAGLTYGFVLTGDGSSFSLGDGRVAIRDSLGNVIDSMSDGNLLSFRPTTDGVYYVEVKDDYSYDNAAEGNYRLTSTLSDTLRSDVSTTGSILDGGTVRGRMDVAGDSDWYKLAVVSGRTYTLTVKGDGTATSFDNQQVELRDAAGNRLNYDTGSSTSGGAALTFTATTTGPVYVVVATQAYSSDDGGFLLEVRSDSLVLNGTGGDDVLTGGVQNNTINGLAGNDKLDGGAGNDVVNGGAGNDILIGGAGIDTAVFSSGVSVTVNLRLGTAQVTGEGTDYVLYFENALTGAGNDSLSGNSLANVFVSNSGNDTLRGLEGNDRFDAGLGNDLVDGGVGVDTLVFNGTAGVRLNLASGSAQVTGYGTDTIVGIENVRAGAGADSLIGNSLANVFEGSGGNDTLIGMDGADTLSGSAGDDSLNGGTGNDVLTGGAGNDVLIGGAGIDAVTFLGTAPARVNLAVTAAQATGAGTDILSGFENVITGSGADIVTGDGLGNRIITGAGNDLIVGGAGNDVISADDGIDRITGGAGTDVIWGGAGADSFVFNLHDGGDVIQDYQDGTDRLVIDSGATAFNQLTITQTGANSIVKFGDVSITLVNVSYWMLDSGDFQFI